MPDGEPNILTAGMVGGYEDQEEDSIGLGSILQRCWQAAIRWRLMILGISGACLVASILITLLTAPHYTASAQIEINPGGKSFLSGEVLQSLNEGGDLKFYGAQYTSLTAHSIANRVVKRLNLASSREFFAAHGVYLPETGNKALQKEKLAQRIRKATDLLLANIDVSLVRDQRLVNISYTSRAPELAAKIATTWSEEFVDAKRDRQFASIAQARKGIEERMPVLSAKLDEPQRYKGSSEGSPLDSDIIVRVDAAMVPNLPSSPNIALNLASALLVGLGLSVIAVYSLNHIDEVVRGPNDVPKYLSAPLLGNIPLSTGSPQADLNNPKSPVSKAYVGVQSALALATDHGFPRSIAIVSSRRSEGKSTTALALAEIIGRSGKRVLLIDGDMRCPSQHYILSLCNDVGLSNLLAGEDLTPIIYQETTTRGVLIMSSGSVPLSPAELLSSKRFGDLIETLIKEFDHVVIDSPPVLGFSDSELIGGAVEGVAFIIEAEQTPRRAARASLKRLRSVGIPIFGVIVTKVNTVHQINSHSYGGHYSYNP